MWAGQLKACLLKGCGSSIKQSDHQIRISWATGLMVTWVVCRDVDSQTCSIEVGTWKEQTGQV